nr:MAG TPA: hypothetical protein [Bacteriophage sp.]
MFLIWCIISFLLIRCCDIIRNSIHYYFNSRGNKPKKEGC